MPFTIQWTGPPGLATTTRASPIEAIKIAVDMLGKGYIDVVIVDRTQGGKAYTPAEFATFCLQGCQRLRVAD
jgi:3-oxoacyl-(acyl-carrier-protein) synthase